MDAVRLGRALGVGARQAAKTLVTAVDAATAPSPANHPIGSGTPGPPQSGPPGQSRVQPRPAAPRDLAQKAARTVSQARATSTAVRTGSRNFREKALKPFVRLSGVVWLEVSGLFFGIFALVASTAAWRLRREWHPGSPGNTQLLGAVSMLLIFGYFCISNFLRARTRERRR